MDTKLLFLSMANFSQVRTVSTQSKFKTGRIQQILTCWFFKLIWKCTEKNPSKQFRKKNAGGFTLVTTFYEAIVNKEVWYWRKTIHEGEKSAEIHPCRDQLIFNKNNTVGKREKKKKLFPKRWYNWIPTCKQLNSTRASQFRQNFGMDLGPKHKLLKC